MSSYAFWYLVRALMWGALLGTFVGCLIVALGFA